MNRSWIHLGSAGLCFFVLLGLLGCQGYRDGSTRTVGEFTDDVAIQSRVKLALLNDEAIKGLRINTEVKRGVVTLHGRVQTPELKARALDLTRAVKGVRKVEDKLTVVTE